MATTAKRVTAALVRAGLRGRFSAIDDNNGEVVLWRDGAGIPVWSVREAMAEARKDEAAISLGRRGGKVTSDAKAASARDNGRKGGRPKKDTTRRLSMIAILALTLLLFAGCAMPQAILRDPVSGQTVNCTYMSEVNTPINSFPTRGSAGRAIGQGMADGIASAFREQDCVNNYRAVGFQPMR